MQHTAEIYIRVGTQRTRVTFSKGKPQLLKDYDGAFYVRTRQNGNRVWLKYSTIDEAKAQRNAILSNIDQGLPPTVGIVPPAGPTAVSPATPADTNTIAGAVDAYIQECEDRIQSWRDGDANGLAPTSVTAYKRAMNNLKKSCAQIDAVLMSEFKDAARGAAILKHHKTWLQANTQRRGGKAAYSDSRQFVVINKFLAGQGVKMAKDKTVNPNDAGLLKRTDVPKTAKVKAIDVVYYTPADIKAMLLACPTVNYKKNNNKCLYDAQDLQDLLLIFFWTGCRDEEIQHLEWTDIIWKNGTSGKIVIQDKPKWDWKVKDHEKRQIPMTPKLQELLKARQVRMQTEAWKQTHVGYRSDLLFSTGVGTPNQNFADSISRLQERAVIGEVKRNKPTENNRKPYEFSRIETRRHILHNFRKTFATRRMCQGATPRNIQHELGHSELETTERYLGLVDNPQQTEAEYAAIRPI